MADNAILFKYLAKSIGMKHGVMPSFMAKPWGNVSMDFIDLYEAYSWRFGSFPDAVGEFRPSGKTVKRKHTYVGNSTATSTSRFGTNLERIHLLFRMKN
jgi:hypothetical protein